MECSSSEDEGDKQPNNGFIEDAQTPLEQGFFTPLESVVALDSSVHSSFDAYVASLPSKNSHVVSDERFQRFVSIFKNDTAGIEHTQLKRDREKLFNTKEVGPKAPDGTQFPYGKWEVHSCVDTRTGECIERPKRENTYKGGKQAMVPASECEAVIHKVHTLGGHKGQERTWKDIAGAYHGIPQDLVKTYIKNCSCTSARAGRAAKRKRAGTAMWAPSAWFRVEADLIDMTEQPSMSEGKVYSYILQIIDQKTLFTLLAPLETKTAREVSEHLYRWFGEHGVPQVLHTDNRGEFTGTVLVTKLRRFFPSLRITTGASRKPWVQGCVEQAHNAVYSYLHHLREIHGGTFSWAELLPSVAYMHNTAVQTHKSESPMFQRDGRDNRLVNADTLVTEDVLPEDEYRRRFDAHFGIRPGKQVVASLPVCNGPDNTGDESEEHARCNRSSGIEAGTLTRAYDARQERAESDNARAVQRNQKRMSAQTAADEVLFTEGDTVLIRVPQRCRTKLDPANIVGCVRSVHITNVERRYKIATQAGMLNRMLSGADLAKRTDGVTISSEDDHAMQTTVDEISLQHAARVAIGRAQGSQPREESASRRTRRPPTWWRSALL
jgi:hypothetical protein